MTDRPAASEVVLYRTEDGRTRIECRFEGETLWLTQALTAELFQKDVRTINEHLVNGYDEGELEQEATVRKFRIVRTEGNRSVSREIEHYNPAAILAAKPRAVDAAFERVVKQLEKPVAKRGKKKPRNE